jgi:hypothetical protein
MKLPRDADVRSLNDDGFRSPVTPSIIELLTFVLARKRLHGGASANPEELMFRPVGEELSKIYKAKSKRSGTPEF